MEEIYCFAGNPLDRVSERRRDAGWISSLLVEPSTRLIPLRDLKPAIHNGSQMALDWQPVGPWREAIAAGATLVLLGIAEGRAHFALDATGADLPPDPVTENIDVRTLAPLIAGPEAAILAEARSVVDWHARHRFCAQCGTPSETVAGGWTRHCPACKAHPFARRPVVIMLAVRGERAARPWPPPPRRAIFLPCRVHGLVRHWRTRSPRGPRGPAYCGRVRYLASSWPFPSTLMMALAEAAERSPSTRARRGALV
jgi:NAD+ diphosphatase